MASRQILNPVSLAYLVTIPLGLVLGLAVSNPLSKANIFIAFAVLAVLTSPIILRHHHAILVVCWNAALVVFFLPGQPMLWAVLAVISLSISIVSRTLTKQSRFIHAPMVAWPLILLAIVVVVTAAMTGGFGGRALGSNMWGAKRYLGVLGAICGFFALTAQRIPLHRANLLTAIFLLAGATAIFSDVVFLMGPSFYFLFNFFPFEMAANQALTQDTLQRSTGLAWASQSLYYFMLLRYGLVGILNPFKPWRIAAFFGIFIVGLLGGFRSSIILFGLITIAQFCIEKLYKTRYLPILASASILAGTGLILFSEQLPLSMQRALSFLPIDVHPMARTDAEGTLHWRLEMWRVVVRDIPDYLILGKGYAFNGTDYMLTQEAIRRGMFKSYEDTLISGNYHNGILTLLIPFGIFGAMAFALFCCASLWILFQNYRYGPRELNKINSFFLAFFLCRLCFYLVFYGQFELDLMIFTGTVALSLSVNGGVCRQPKARPALPDTDPPPAAI